MLTYLALHQVRTKTPDRNQDLNLTRIYCHPSKPKIMKLIKIKDKTKADRDWEEQWMVKNDQQTLMLTSSWELSVYFTIYKTLSCALICWYRKQNWFSKLKVKPKNSLYFLFISYLEYSEATFHKLWDSFHLMTMKMLTCTQTQKLKICRELC